MCDRCLGRAFGRAGRGLDNATRGRLIRGAIAAGAPPADLAAVAALLAGGAQAAAPDAHNVSADACPICEGLLLAENIQRYAKMCHDALSAVEFSNFQIGSRFDHEITASEEALWAGLGESQPESIKTETNREVGKLVEVLSGRPAEMEHPDVVAILDTRFDTVELQIGPVFIYGRYRKLERGVPQTRWPCRLCEGRGCERCGNTGKMYTTSVEEEISRPVVESMEGSEAFLHGMGREDIDARMLGRGRPFVLEVRNARRRSADWTQLAEKVNKSSLGRVEVLDIRPSSREEMVRIKASRSEKTYTAVVDLGGDVDREKLISAIASFRGLPIDQQTPNRVAHRRADLLRKRRVIEMELLGLEGRVATVRVRGEAGLYIKELLHGDKGRTQPNLAQVLGIPCTVSALDVLEIHDKT